MPEEEVDIQILTAEGVETPEIIMVVDTLTVVATRVVVDSEVVIAVVASGEATEGAIEVALEAAVVDSAGAATMRTMMFRIGTHLMMRLFERVQHYSLQAPDMEITVQASKHLNSKHHNNNNDHTITNQTTICILRSLRNE